MQTKKEEESSEKKLKEYDMSFFSFFKKTVKEILLMGGLLIVLLLLLLVASKSTTAIYINCYQESANISNQTGIDGNCNLSYTGNYQYNSFWGSTITDLIDGNWSTFGQDQSPGSDNALINITYIKPIYSSQGSIWTIHNVFRGLVNFTIPSDCWNYNNTYVYFRILSATNTVPPGNSGSIYYCYNSTWKEIYNNASGNGGESATYEEAIYWNTSTIIINNIKAYTKFNNQEITGNFKINGTTFTTNYFLENEGYYNFSFNNTSYHQKDLIKYINDPFEGSINISNVTNSNIIFTVIDNDTGSAVSSPTINVSYDGISETTSSYTTFNVTQNLTYTVTFSKTGYKTRIVNITPTNQSYPYSINLSPSNKVYVTIRDDTTSSIIAQLIYVYFQNNASLFNYNTTTGYLNATNITSGDYTISFITANGNYTTRSYEATIDEDTSPSITARLLLNSSATQIGIYTKKTTYEQLGNVLVTVQKQYSGGSYATIQQVVTDVNGYGLLSITNGETYRIILSADGYATKQFEITFYNANSPYTWLISESTEGPYINYLDGVQYYFSPNTTQIDQGLTNFSITTYNASFSVSWTSVNTNGTITNVSGSPGGSTASNQVNLSNYIGVYPVIFSFNYLDPNTNTYKTINIPINYFVGNYTYFDNNIKDSLEDLKNEIEGDEDVSGGIWLVILALFITIAGIVTVMQLSGNTTAGVVVGFGFSIFFAVIGWLSPIMIAAQGIILVMILFIQR
jgi:hypothetical protein